MNLDTYTVPVKFKVDAASFGAIDRKLKAVSDKAKSTPLKFSVNAESTKKARDALKSIKIKASSIPLKFSVNAGSTKKARDILTALKRKSARIPIGFKVSAGSSRKAKEALRKVSKKAGSVTIKFSVNPESTRKARAALRKLELRAARIPVGFTITPDGTRRARTALRNIEQRAANIRLNFNPNGGGPFPPPGQNPNRSRVGGVGGAIAAGVSIIGADKAKDFFLSSIKLAKDFETVMIDANAILRATPEEMKRLETAAKQIGSTTSLTASQSAGAIEILARNDLKAEQILNGALTSSVDLALAMRADLGGSADLMTDVIAQFNLKGADMIKTTDLLAGATVNSKFGFNDMRLAIAQAGGVAGKVGVDFDDFVGVLALTSSSFSSGADAGTSFKTFLTTLNPKSKAASAAMRDLGLMTEEGSNKFFDASGNMESMSNIAGLLETAFKDLTEAERLEASQTIFGQDAMRTALSLADQGKKGFDKLAGSIDKVTAAELKAAKEKGLQGALNRLNSAWESFKMNLISKDTLAYLTKLTDKLSAILTTITNMPGAFDGVVKAAKVTTKAIETVNTAKTTVKLAKKTVDAVTKKVEASGGIKGVATSVVGNKTAEDIAKFWKAGAATREQSRKELQTNTKAAAKPQKIEINQTFKNTDPVTVKEATRQGVSKGISARDGGEYGILNGLGGA